MKTYRNLYPQVWAFDNLYTAYRRARKGKRGKATVAAFERKHSTLFSVIAKPRRG